MILLIELSRPKWIQFIYFLLDLVKVLTPTDRLLITKLEICIDFKEVALENQILKIQYSFHKCYWLEDCVHIYGNKRYVENQKQRKTSNIPLSAIITWSNITWYCKHHFSDWGRMYIRVLINNTPHTLPQQASHGVSLVTEIWLCYKWYHTVLHINFTSVTANQKWNS